MTDSQTTASDKNPRTARVLMFDVSLPWANFWYDAFNVMLFLGAFAVAVGTYGSIKMGAVKERFSDERTAALETQTVQAKAELGTAQADIAKANAQIAEAKKQTAALEKDTANARKGIVEANARALEAQAELARFKAPRSIAEADRAALIPALEKFAGTKVAIYILGDGPEPNGLGASINDILTRARWASLTWNWSGAGAATGVIILFKAGTEGDIGPACDAIVAALNSVHVGAAKEVWPGDWNQFGGMLNGPNPPAPTEAPIRIIIGTKPQ